MMLFDGVNISTANETFIGVIVGALVIFLAVMRRLKSQKEPGELRNTLSYRERFEQMKADAEAKYGPSVRFLRPEMDLSDDPELFEQAWKEFQQEDKRDLASQSIDA